VSRLDVVLATGDRTLRRLVVALLGNEGYAVHPVDTAPERVLRLVDARRPEVVIADVPEAACERLAAMLRDSGHSVGMVRVTDEGAGDSSARPPVIARAAGPAALFAAVSRAAKASRARAAPPSGHGGGPRPIR
jgi:CheY-like chemotaxis protein